MGATEPGQKKLPSTLLGRLLLGVAAIGFVVAVALFLLVAVVLPD